MRGRKSNTGNEGGSTLGSPSFEGFACPDLPNPSGLLSGGDQAAGNCRLWCEKASGTSSGEAACDCAQCADDAIRLADHLGVRKAQRRQSGEHVRLVALPVFGLLCWCPVVAQTVCLHHESKSRPVEVRSVISDERSGQRFRQVGASNEAKEPPLELRVSQGEDPAVQQLAELGSSSGAPFSSQSRLQSVWADQVKPVGLVHSRFQLPNAQLGGEINEGPGCRCNRDPCTPGETGSAQV